MSKTRPKKSEPGGDGMIFPEVLYRLSVLAKQLGWGERSIRRARREGLRVLRFGRIRWP